MRWISYRVIIGFRRERNQFMTVSGKPGLRSGKTQKKPVSFDPEL
jgi:hypothetical protein